MLSPVQLRLPIAPRREIIAAGRCAMPCYICGSDAVPSARVRDTHDNRDTGERCAACHRIQ